MLWGVNLEMHSIKTLEEKQSSKNPVTKIYLPSVRKELGTPGISDWCFAFWTSRQLPQPPNPPPPPPMENTGSVAGFFALPLYYVVAHRLFISLPLPYMGMHPVNFPSIYGILLKSYKFMGNKFTGNLWDLCPCKVRGGLSYIRVSEKCYTVTKYVCVDHRWNFYQ